MLVEDLPEEEHGTARHQSQRDRRRLRAAVFAQITRVYSGEEETPPPGIPPMPDDPSLSMRER